MAEQTKTSEEHYIASYHNRRSNGGKNAPEWLRLLQDEAIERFQSLGFPTVKHEEWQFTNIAPFLKTALAPSTPAAANVRREILEEFLVHSDAPVIVLVDGYFEEALSSVPDSTGIRVQRYDAVSAQQPSEQTLSALAEISSASQKNPFSALSLALTQNVIMIDVPEGAQVSQPVHVLHLSTQTGKEAAMVSSPTLLVHAGKESSLLLLEVFTGAADADYGVVSAAGVVIREGATVDHVRVQREGAKAFHFGTLAVRQERKSRYTAFSLAMGGSIARTDVTIAIDGEDCETMLDGLYISAGEQLVDHHTFIDHRYPNCSSREIFKGIVTGKSRAVFNGKIYVHHEAQGTDSKQTNKNLLLSNEATVDTKPQLEIFADDVKCTHGATVGGLDPAGLFYLKSRAIDEEAARDLLTLGFAGEVTAFIRDESIRHLIDALIVKQLQTMVAHTALPEIVH